MYDRNFIAKYGEIDPEQSWDLSKYAMDESPAIETRGTINNSHSITVQSRANTRGYNRLSFINTQDVFTVELMEVEHGSILADDRKSEEWFNSTNDPWTRNGHRAFVKAAYAAPTEENPNVPGCILTAVPDDGYAFVKWEQYNGTTL